MATFMPALVQVDSSCPDVAYSWLLFLSEMRTSLPCAVGQPSSKNGYNTLKTTCCSTP